MTWTLWCSLCLRRWPSTRYTAYARSHQPRRSHPKRRSACRTTPRTAPCPPLRARDVAAPAVPAVVAAVEAPPPLRRRHTRSLRWARLPPTLHRSRCPSTAQLGVLLHPRMVPLPPTQHQLRGAPRPRHRREPHPATQAKRGAPLLLPMAGLRPTCRHRYGALHRSPPPRPPTALPLRATPVMARLLRLYLPRPCQPGAPPLHLSLTLRCPSRVPT
jgi:hypothetical protein